MDHQDLVQYPTTQMDDNQHEMMRAAVVSSLGQAAASQSHDAGVDGGQTEGESLEIGELPLDMGFGSGGDDEGGVGDVTGDSLGEGLADAGDEGGGHDSTSPSSNKRRSTNGTSGTPKRSKANANAGTPLTEEEKKVKLREANRKAAERSRGKKRGELHALEETVRNIQEENARLRTQLESLLAIATTSSATTTTTTSAEAGPSQSIDPTLSSGGDIPVPGDVDTPYNAMPITGLLGELGLDIPLLSSLHRQIITLRAQVAERERTLDPTISTPSTATTDKQLRSERTALISLIAHLKEEREKIDRENALLEREIKQKKVVNGVVEGAPQEEEKKDGDDSVAVERALIEIRSWLDEALKGWQDTGVLKRPPTTSLPTRDSAQTVQTSNPTDEYHPDFSFQAEDLTPEQVNQYAQAYATSMGGGTGQEHGQGHMNLLSEVSMTQGR